METILRIGLSNAAAAALLALGVSLLAWPLRGQPALRHRLWLLVLLKLVTPPLWDVGVPWPSRPRDQPPLVLDVVTPAVESLLVEAEDQDALSVTPTTESAAPAVPLRWESVVGGAWLAGSALTFAVSFLRVRRFQRILRAAEPVAPDVQEQVAALAARIGLRRVPGAGWVRGAVSPLLWAVFCRPRLILPRGLWDRLDAVQRETLLVHELAHLRRRDHWVRALEWAVTCLYWWFPVVWWTRHALRDAEEPCCDAWVVWSFPDAARRYAETLVETLDFLSASASVVPAAASGLGRVSLLKRRVTMIMLGTTPRRLTWSGTLFCLGLAAALLPLAPSWAQVDPKPKPQGSVVSDKDDVVEIKIGADEALDARIPHLVLLSRQAAADEKDGDTAAKEPDKDAVIRRLKDALKQLPEGKDAPKETQAARQALLEAIKSLEMKSDWAKLSAKRVRVYTKVVTDGQQADLEKLKAEIEQRAAIVREKQVEFERAAAALQHARVRLAQAQGSTMVFGIDRAAPMAPGGMAPGLPPGVRLTPPDFLLGKPVQAPPEAESRISKIESELKRLSEELSKLRQDSGQQKKP